MVGQPGDRVLLVDDEPLIRRLISEYLVAAGYVVRVAVDGLDVLDKLRAGLPDLIITDLNMPRMSGIELLAVVRKRFPQIPVIVISAADADELPREVRADAYIQKSGFGFEPLGETIAGVTRKPPPRMPSPRVEDEPVQARWHNDGHYVVECPECMRSTLAPPHPRVIRGNPITTCNHCRGVIPLRIDAGKVRDGRG